MYNRERENKGKWNVYDLEKYIMLIELQWQCLACGLQLFLDVKEMDDVRIHFIMMRVSEKQEHLIVHLRDKGWFPKIKK